VQLLALIDLDAETSAIALRFVAPCRSLYGFNEPAGVKKHKLFEVFSFDRNNVLNKKESKKIKQNTKQKTGTKRRKPREHDGKNGKVQANEEVENDTVAQEEGANETDNQPKLKKGTKKNHY
jgi:hypothetical protein